MRGETRSRRLDTSRGLIPLIFTILLLAASVAYTIAIATVDVKPLGANESLIGLASLNVPIFKVLFISEFFDTFSDCLLLISVLVLLFIAIQAFQQLRERKSILALDSDYLCLAGICVVLVVLYVVFEFVELNYRPLPVEGQLEASFPSSHTLACCTIMACVATRARARTETLGGATLTIVLCVTMIIFMTGSRVLSGEHWFTDVTCSTLYALTLAAAYATAVAKMDAMRESGRFAFKSSEQGEGDGAAGKHAANTGGLSALAALVGLGHSKGKHAGGKHAAGAQAEDVRVDACADGEPSDEAAEDGEPAEDERADEAPEGTNGDAATEDVESADEAAVEAPAEDAAATEDDEPAEDATATEDDLEGDEAAEDATPKIEPAEDANANAEPAEGKHALGKHASNNATEDLDDTEEEPANEDDAPLGKHAAGKHAAGKHAR